MTTRTRTLVAALAVLAALTACSAEGSSDSGGGMTAQEAEQQAADLAAPQGAADDAGGRDAGAPAGQDAQQVVQTARATVVAPDPVAAAHEVVRLTTRLDGRVDARYERSGADEDDPGSATLTLRVPAPAVATLRTDLAGIGEVREFQVSTEDVTNAAQDLDARIAATELSVDRMSALLARASTSSEIIEAEGALTERQANLERLRSQRSSLADRVALSTVEVEIYAPERAPVVEEKEPPTFLDGLETGWASFVATVRTVLVVVGVLLPWLVLGGLVAGAVLLWRRRRPGTRAAAAPPTGPGGPPAAPPSAPGTTPPGDPTAPR